MAKTKEVNKAGSDREQAVESARIQLEQWQEHKQAKRHGLMWYDQCASILPYMTDDFISVKQDVNIDCSRTFGLIPKSASIMLDAVYFLNAVLRGQTSLSADTLLEKIHGIEHDGGRLRNKPKGPRTIDIDILLYGNEIIRHIRQDGSTLIIPHQSMALRLFVLLPLLELDSDLSDPRDGIAFSQKASHLSDQQVKLYRE